MASAVPDVDSPERLARRRELRQQTVEKHRLLRRLGEEEAALVAQIAEDETEYGVRSHASARTLSRSSLMCCNSGVAGRLAVAMRGLTSVRKQSGGWWR